MVTQNLVLVVGALGLPDVAAAIVGDQHVGFGPVWSAGGPGAPEVVLVSPPVGLPLQRDVCQAYPQLSVQTTVRRKKKNDVL